MLIIKQRTKGVFDKLVALFTKITIIYINYSSALVFVLLVLDTFFMYPVGEYNMSLSKNANPLMIKVYNYIGCKCVSTVRPTRIQMSKLGSK